MIKSGLIYPIMFSCFYKILHYNRTVLLHDKIKCVVLLGQFSCEQNHKVCTEILLIIKNNKTGKTLETPQHIKLLPKAFNFFHTFIRLTNCWHNVVHTVFHYWFCTKNTNHRHLIFMHYWVIRSCCWICFSPAANTSLVFQQFLQIEKHGQREIT